MVARSRRTLRALSGSYQDDGIDDNDEKPANENLRRV